jgi:hypothetical protein
VNVASDPAEADKIRKKWEVWGEGIRLVILNSPYRLLIEPLLTYLNRLESIQQPNELLTIVVPQFKPRHSWENILHMRTADTLRKVLLNREDIVIVEVPYQVK